MTKLSSLMRKCLKTHGNDKSSDSNYNNQLNKFIYFHKNIYIMKKEIKNQERFQILDGSAAVTVPSGTYTLFVSSDGETYTQKGEAIDGPETIVLANAPQGLYCYIDGIAEGTNVTLLL